MNQELDQEPLGFTQKYWFPQNLILKFTQHSIKESQLYSSIL